MALRVIGGDDLGKEAIRESLKSVKLTNLKDKVAKKMSFDGGVRCRIAGRFIPCRGRSPVDGDPIGA
jgi:hypothetical protein